MGMTQKPALKRGDNYSTPLPLVLVHPDGARESVVVKLTITRQQGWTDWPRLICRQCLRSMPFTDLLRLTVDDGNYTLILFKSDHCYHCNPRSPVATLLRRVMPVRIRPVRGDDSNPIRWLDEKKSRRLSFNLLQFRFMKKTVRPLVLRLQPYRDRKHAKDGTKYT